MPQIHNLTVERLRAEIANEKHTLDRLDSSVSELRALIYELERKSKQFSQDSSEWETRYALQVEMNQQLDMQALVLTERIEQAKQFFKDEKFPKTTQMFEDADEITPQYLKQLRRSKRIFEEQLRDLEWRLEQESKAYHKANEERKNFVLDISALRDYSWSPGMQGKEESRRIYPPILSPRAMAFPSISPDCRQKVLVKKPSRGVPWTDGLTVDGYYMANPYE